MILFLSFCGTEEVRAPQAEKETQKEKDSDIASKEAAKKERQKKIEDVSKTIETEKNNAELYNKRGNLKSANEDFNAAIEDFTTAISLNPKFANAFFNRAHAKLGLDNPKEAIDDLNKAISINPNDDDFFLDRGVIKSNLNDKKGAIEDYSKAISLNPKNAMAFNNRGFAYYELKKYKQAIEEYSQSISIDPKQDRAYNNRVHARIAIGDFQGAQEDRKTALENSGKAQDDSDTSMNWIEAKNMLWSIEKKDTDYVDVDQIQSFQNAWFNSKENPNIENSIEYNKNEFEYNKDKASFAETRRKKYVLTSNYIVQGEYDFKKQGYNIRSNGRMFNTLPDKSENVIEGFNFNLVDRLYIVKNPISIGDYFKTTAFFKIPSQEAETIFKNKPSVYILSKITAATHSSPAQCVYPKDYYEQRDNEFRECENKYRNKKSVTYKTFKIETLRYYINDNGTIYKNY